MKATITTTTGTIALEEVQNTEGVPDIAIEGEMFGMEGIVNLRHTWLFIPIKNLIKIEIHE